MLNVQAARTKPIISERGPHFLYKSAKKIVILEYLLVFRNGELHTVRGMPVWDPWLRRLFVRAGREKGDVGTG